MIVLDRVTKKYRDTMSLHDISARISAGSITALLGPNGSGKTTLLRVVTGLIAPSSGSVSIGRSRAGDGFQPRIGAFLHAESLPLEASARAYLRHIAAMTPAHCMRVEEALEFVGLADVRAKRIRQYSLGMKQRLGIASVIMRDPEILIFDEPSNGLDPEGIAWFRNLLTTYSAQGKTIIISSHFIAGVEQTAGHIVLLNRGRLLASEPIREFCSQGASTGATVRVQSQQKNEIESVLAKAKISYISTPSHTIVQGLAPEDVAALVYSRGLTLSELTAQTLSLEESFFQRLSTDEEAPRDKH
ncbi:ABC transporter ATP-binding protein [Falsarthrobacter nasiphocae]|uniref:ABC-2 type transport system ATP-binding protein n=1 Tax=Falsarthrobacter nasiphocae TaxID=189863 RepID=A0AAE4C7C1_9MICC|nr:ATP-binding cassette domain-containing protein [Falsarthrobacter nasiphocae]MDR6891295.1 ABC-2 type transport system ATP-binding protein [Falsarthrobacter nasiphocae]